MKEKLLEIKQLTDLKYLNMYQAIFELENGRVIHYNFASRRSLEDLECKKGGFVDAVKILPYYKKNGKTYIVLIKEFRFILNKYIYDLPAGLAENQDDIIGDAKRELLEEIGAQVKSIKEIAKPGYTSVGLTDETMSCYFAEVESLGDQHLEETEDISLKTITLEEIPSFLEKEEMGVTGNLLLQLFYIQNQK